MKSGRNGFVIALILGLCLAGACGEADPTGPPEPGNVAPTLAPITDRSVIRNLETPRSVEVEIGITDPDDTRHTVTVRSDDEDVLPSSEVTCGTGVCTVTLAPDASADADLAVTVVAVDDEGGEDQTSFALRVQPLLVTTTADAGAGSLRRVLAAAEPGDVVGFDRAGAFSSEAEIELSSEIVVDRQVTIEGPGREDLTVSGGSITRVFRVAEGVAVTILDLTIADGVASSVQIGGAEGVWGGAVLTLPESVVTLRRVAVVRSVASRGDEGDGGGIANVGGTLVVEESLVAENDAFDGGGGVFSVIVGGRSPIVRLVESTVADNRAGRGGGVWALGTLAVEGGSLDSNVATTDGGAIYAVGSATIRDASMTANDAGQAGGGLFVWPGGTLRVFDSTISENRAESRGGGGIFTDDAVLVLERVALTGNVTASASGGGARLDGGSITISDSELRGNTATSFGGGLWISAGADVQITGGSIAENSASYGGGIAMSEVSVRLIDGDVRSNAVRTGGGGIWAKASSLDLTEGTRVGNNTSELFGAGIYANDGSQVDIDGESVVIANEAEMDGAGVYLLGADTDLDVEGTSCLILGNIAGGSGGGIYNRGSDIRDVPVPRVCLNSPDDIFVES